jgi:hypothetical protein
MTENLSFDFNTAYNEIKERAEAEGVASKAGYDSIVEDYINEILGYGELDKDEDLEAIIEELKAMWLEYEKNLNIR